MNLPAIRAVERKEIALNGALETLAPGPWLERPDSPDGVVTAVRRLPPVAAKYAAFPAELDPRLRAALERRGVEQLYCHQAEAFAHIAGGGNVVVTTPTASGKTLCYNLPVLDTILKDPAARALYLFPTKALAQDQMAELHELVGQVSDAGGMEIGVHTYDGDTPADARRTIRTRAHVVLSNPDMLHSGILPHHPRWAKLFENLRYIVIDELHAYRGVFGSHLCNVLRRLRRVARHYGSDPQFICSSATIANPRELAERLTERPFALVSESGAPRGEKFFVFINPPVVNRELGIRRSYLSETRRVAGEFLRRHLQVIVFAQSRLTTEILTTYLKEDFEDVPGMPELIRGLPRRLPAAAPSRDRTWVARGARPRRRLDQRPRAGHRHRRAGRRRARRLSGNDRRDVAACGPCRPPERAIGRRIGGLERADRPVRRAPSVVLLRCLARTCADQSRQPAHPRRAREVRGLRAAVLDPRRVRHGQRAGSAGRACRRAGLVHQSGASPDSDEAIGHWHWTSESYPADAVSLRSISSDNFVVVDQTRGSTVIGETNFTSGPSTLHPKAIYIVEGRLYQVERLDFEGRKAYVREVDCDYYTDAIDYTRVTILDCFGRDAADVAHHGEVHVVSRVVGFKKIRFYTNENVGSGDLDLPEQQMHTTSYWLEIPLDVMAALPFSPDDRRDGVFGLAFAMQSHRGVAADVRCPRPRALDQCRRAQSGRTR